MRGYIYATAAAGVGGGFKADSLHAATPPAPCHAACHAPCTLQHVRCALCAVPRCCVCVLLLLRINGGASHPRRLGCWPLATGWVDMFSRLSAHLPATSLLPIPLRGIGSGHIGILGIFPCFGHWVNRCIGEARLYVSP